jgi:hypothetical protein
MEALVLKRSNPVSHSFMRQRRSVCTITGHAGLAGDTSGDEDDLGALEGLGEARGSSIISADLEIVSRRSAFGLCQCIIPRSWC